MPCAKFYNTGGSRYLPFVTIRHARCSSGSPGSTPERKVGHDLATRTHCFPDHRIRCTTLVLCSCTRTGTTDTEATGIWTRPRVLPNAGPVDGLRADAHAPQPRAARPRPAAAPGAHQGARADLRTGAQEQRMAGATRTAVHPAHRLRMLSRRGRAIPLAGLDQPDAPQPGAREPAHAHRLPGAPGAALPAGRQERPAAAR